MNVGTTWKRRKTDLYLCALVRAAGMQFDAVAGPFFPVAGAFAGRYSRYL